MRPREAQPIRIRWPALGALWLLATAVCLAAGAAAAGPTRGILWQVERDGTPVAHLFGTIHSDRPEVLDLAEPVVRAFDRARRYAFELDLRTLDRAEMGRAMQLEAGVTLEQWLPPALWHRARALARERGLPLATAARLEPWALAITLALPPTDPRRVLDHHLQRAALARGQPVTGLETVAEQLAVFDRLDRQRQVALLRETVEQLETGGAGRLYDQLIEAWLARDLERMLALAERHPALPAGDGNDALMDRLLHERNRRMLERMQPLLAAGDAFIAVGALHLAGETGLVRLLERQGYTLRPIH